MSKKKRKDNDKEPPRLFREFNDYPVDEVMEVARMLYAIKPFKLTGAMAALHWSDLVWNANLFLDKLHAKVVEIAQRRRRLHDRKAQIAEAEELLHDPVPVDKGVRYITDKGRTTDALRNFRKFVRYLPRYFGGVVGKPQTPEALFEHWRKTGGMPRDWAIEMRILYQDTWPLVLAKEQSEKARKRKH
jgi:hypothetical protein